MGKRKRKPDRNVVGKTESGQPIYEATEADTKPDWKHSCEVCGQKPIVPLTGMCGPCTFGEADTAGGNW